VGRPYDLGMAGTHRWPVTLRFGPVSLVPIRLRNHREWEAVRQANHSWLKPWEATLPPGSDRGPTSYSSMVRLLTGQAREHRMLPWLVRYDLDDGRNVLAGQLTVGGIVGGSAASGQIGYWVDHRLAGRGIIPAAVALASDYCFEVLRLHRIEITIRPENLPSLRVVEKLGFRPEGLRPGYLHIDGAWRDHLVFALNADEVPGGLRQRWAEQRASS
jgi:[ribosomal protein S5]-alanine N-acetyltransferase